MKPWPRNVRKNVEDIVSVLKYMIRARSDDIVDFNNLNNVFISGRKVGKIPSSSTDIESSDKVGDFTYDTSYIYILVDNAGTAVWRRSTLGSW